MNINSDAVLARFIEFGQSKFGTNHGWQKRFADGLEISPQQLSNILAKRAPIGPKVRERLDELGCDRVWFRTGEKSDAAKKKEDAFVAFHAPAGVPEATQKAIQKMINDLTELEPDDIESARRIVREAFKKKK